MIIYVSTIFWQKYDKWNSRGLETRKTARLNGADVGGGVEGVKILEHEHRLAYLSNG